MDTQHILLAMLEFAAAQPNSVVAKVFEEFWLTAPAVQDELERGTSASPGQVASGHKMLIDTADPDARVSARVLRSIYAAERAGATSVFHLRKLFSTAKAIAELSSSQTISTRELLLATALCPKCLGHKLLMAASQTSAGTPPTALSQIDQLLLTRRVDEVGQRELGEWLVSDNVWGILRRALELSGRDVSPSSGSAIGKPADSPLTSAHLIQACASMPDSVGYRALQSAGFDLTKLTPSV